MGLLECAGISSGWHIALDEDGREPNVSNFKASPAVPLTRREEQDEGPGTSTENLSLDLFSGSIEFLHRSLREFLQKPAMQELLHLYTQGEFDSRLFLCNARVVQFYTLLATKPHGDLTLGMASHILGALSVSPHSQAAAKLTDLIRGGVEVLTKLHTNSSGGWYINSSLYSWNHEKSNFLSLAIDFKLVSYIVPRLTRDAIQRKEGRPILDYILRLRFADATVFGINRRWPEPNLVRTALENDADPNEMSQNTGVTIWASFLSFSREQIARVSIAEDCKSCKHLYLQVMELLINACAIPILFKTSLSVIGRSTGSTSKYGRRRTAPQPPSSFWFRERWPRASPINVDPGIDESEPFYSVGDLLEHFRDGFGASIDPLQKLLKVKEEGYLKTFRSRTETGW